MHRTIGENQKAEKAWNELPKDSDALRYAENRIEFLEREIYRLWTERDRVRYECEKRVDMLSGGA